MTFSFKIHPEDNLQRNKIKWLCILFWNQADRWVLQFWDREDKKQGWVRSYTYTTLCSKTADNKKPELSFQYEICVFSLGKPAFSGSHVSSPRGWEPIWSRVNQMGKSHIAAAADGSSGGRSHRDPPSQTSIPCQKLCWFFFAKFFIFLRPDQMVCEALTSSSYRHLRKNGRVEVKGELLAAVRVCPLLQRIPALRAHQAPVSHRKHFKRKFSSSLYVS